MSWVRIDSAWMRISLLLGPDQQPCEVQQKFSKTRLIVTGTHSGVTRREQGGHNSPGANSLWGCWITAGAPNYCGSRLKVPTVSKYFLQHSKFAFERAQVQTWRRQTSTMGATVRPQGRQTCFLPRAPCNLVTTLGTRQVTIIFGMLLITFSLFCLFLVHSTAV